MFSFYFRVIFEKNQMRSYKEFYPIALLSLLFYWKISEDLHRNAAGGQQADPILVWIASRASQED